jgi:hypothetical protein
MDGHPPATAVLCPCSLSQRFKEAVMNITLFHSFQFVLFLALRCITRGGSIAFTGLSRRWGCLVQLEAEMSCTVRDRDVLPSRRRSCLVWPETKMCCIAGDGDVSYGRRWLLTLVQADGIQPYWYVHIYTGLVALFHRKIKLLQNHYLNSL